MTWQVCFVSLSAYGYFNPEAPLGGGAQRQLSLLGRELADEFEVSFVVGDYGQPVRERRDSITFYRAYRPDADTSTVSQLTRLWQLRRAMGQADADIYVYRGRPWKAAFTYLLATSLGKPYVYNLANDPNVDEQPAALPAPVRWLFNRALRDAATVIAQTPRQAQRLEDFYDVRAAVVPNGYPVDITVTSHEQREHFLWVGRLDSEQKRPHYYLDLAERIDSETFLLVGPDGQDESYNERIRNRAEQLENVIDMGTVPPNEIHNLYRDAIALINTSAYEGFPNTYLEAWRYETPILALEIDPGRFVNPDVNGHAAGDMKKLVSLTRSLCEDSGARRSLGKPAAEYVRSELSIERVASQYAQVLENALDVHRDT